jgi:hypothetical protein
VANKNTIILNGKHYDAVSGVIVASHSKKAAKGQPHLVDSFVRSSSASSPHKMTATQPKRPMRLVARSAKPHPQPAQTLMRHAVKKPSGLSKPLVKAQTPTTSSGQSITVHTSPISLHKAASQTIDMERFERAKHITQPKEIQHFVPVTKSTYTPVPQAPIVTPRPAPTMDAAPAEQTASQNIFEKALASSTSHQETYAGPATKKAKRRQHAGFAALLITALAVAGFVAYLNVPNLTMTLASARAGFHASIPGYLPSGFSTKHVSYQTGTVSTQYNSNSDSRSFTIVQKGSDWDSSALVTNYVSMTNVSYQTYQIKGRNVYIYGDGNATWVDGGVWYTVTSSGNLPNKQLLDIAASL